MKFIHVIYPQDRAKNCFYCLCTSLIVITKFEKAREASALGRFNNKNSLPLINKALLLIIRKPPIQYL